MSDANHYKQRLRMLLPFAQHKHECAYARWLVEWLHTRYTVDSTMQMPACNCGFNALRNAVVAEIGKEDL